MARLLKNKWFLGGMGLFVSACASMGLALMVGMPFLESCVLLFVTSLLGVGLPNLELGEQPRHKVKLTLQRLSKENRLRLQDKHGTISLKGKMSSQPVQLTAHVSIEAPTPELTFGLEVMPGITKRDWGTTQGKLQKKLRRVLLHEESWASLQPHLALPLAQRIPYTATTSPRSSTPPGETFTWNKQMGIALLNPAIVSALKALQQRKARLRATTHRLEFIFPGPVSQWEEDTDTLFALLAPLMFVFKHPDQALLRVIRKAPTTDQRLQALEVLLIRYPYTKGWEAAIEQLWQQRSIPEPDLLVLLQPLAAHGLEHPKVKEVLMRSRQHRSAAVYTTAALLLGTDEELSFVRKKLHEGRLPEEVHVRLLQQLTTHPSQADFQESFRRALQHRSHRLQAAGIEQQLTHVLKHKWQEWPLYTGLTQPLLSLLPKAPPQLLQELAGLFLSQPAEEWNTAQAYANLLLLPLFPLSAQLRPNQAKQMLRCITLHRSFEGTRALELLLPHLPPSLHTEGLALLGHCGDANSVAWLAQPKTKALFRDPKRIENITAQIKTRLQDHKEGGLSVADNASPLGQLSVKEQEGELSHAFRGPL